MRCETCYKMDEGSVSMINFYLIEEGLEACESLSAKKFLALIQKQYKNYKKVCGNFLTR